MKISDVTSSTWFKLSLLLCSPFILALSIIFLPITFTLALIFRKQIRILIIQTKDQIKTFLGGQPLYSQVINHLGEVYKNAELVSQGLKDILIQQINKLPYKEQVGKYYSNLVKCLTSVKQQIKQVWRVIKEKCVILLPTRQQDNFGYSLINGSGKTLNNLSQDQEKDRFQLQLYQYLVTSFWKLKTLENLTVLEIDCTNSNGLAYIAKNLSPQLCVGVNENIGQIQQQASSKSINNLQLLQTSLTELNLDQKFDIILNVQKSNNYDNFDEILACIPHLLKDNGNFIFADYRPASQITLLEQKLTANGLKIIDKMDITLCVKQSIKLQNLIKYDPKNTNFIVKIFKNIWYKLPIEYSQFENREQIYMGYNLQKIQ